MEQYNIWGDTEEPFEPPKETNRIKTMQELNGIMEGKTCKTCNNLLKFEYHDKTYYKCKEWRMSHSIATDIRLKSQACGRWSDV